MSVAVWSNHFYFLSLLQKLPMTFDEAASMLERIKGIIIGTNIEEMTIDSFFIAPTDWDLMTDYINKQIQDGPAAAIEAFVGKSFSVYGINRDESGIVPKQTLILLDDWEKLRSN